MRTSGSKVLFCVLLSVWDVLLLAMLLLLPAIWLGAPLTWQAGSAHLRLPWHIWYFAAPAVLLVARYAVRAWATGRHIACAALWEKNWFRKIAFSVLVTFLLFDLMEVALTRIGFEVKFPEVVFEGKDVAGKIHISDVKDDPQLLWRFEPGSRFNGRRINRLGFREREVDPEKQPGTRRVICMGDSVTAQGRPCYSEYLHRLLCDHPPTSNRWEAFNMAVYGYSSLQGLRLFEMNKDKLQPDIVTLYFGWNDHWLNRDDDRQLMALEMKPLAGRVVDALRGKRFFQLIMWALNPVEHLARVEEKGRFHFVHRNIPPTAEVGKQWELRVPPDEYRIVLTAFIREIRSAHAIPLLITAPRRRLTQAIVDRNHAFSIAAAEQIHDQYVEITRAVARDQHAELLDLAHLMAGAECDAFFRPDGIHFDYCEFEESMTRDPDQQPGLMRIAVELDQQIRHIVTTEAWLTK